MCGIFGYFDRSGASLDQSRLLAMAAAIRHRGPDDHGLHAVPGAAVGNQRLSIIGVDDGRQPFFSDDGLIAVVQNGEIYNYIELAAELADRGRPVRSKCDTEVILRLYEELGISFVAKLNGMFAIAILDQRTRSLTLIRDRVGVKPLYLWNDGTRLLFASEIKSILAAGISREVDAQAAHHYLSFNYVPIPFTMFKGVSHLEPGHWLRIDASGVESQRWWHIPNQEAEERSESAWIEEFNAILDDSVRIRMRADVPFGAFLSGGIDSSTVVGLMSRHLGPGVRTFSIGFEEPEYDESVYAQEAIDRFRAKGVIEKVASNMIGLWPLAVYHCDQPHGDVSFLPTYRVAQLAARHVKMVLTGDGADELFAGYTKYRDFFAGPHATNSDDHAFARAYLESTGLFPESGRGELYQDGFAAGVDRSSSVEIVRGCLARASRMDRVSQCLFFDVAQLLPGNNLVKPDRMGMAVSLEARDPFLDPRLIELAFRMPGALKLCGGQTKYIYKRAVSSLLGDHLTYRRKQMFTVPIGEWFKRELRPFCSEVLLGRDAGLDQFFRRAAIERLLQEHWTGLANRTREIRALIAFELWRRIFLQGSFNGPPTLEDLGLSLQSTSSRGG